MSTPTPKLFVKVEYKQGAMGTPTTLNVSDKMTDGWEKRILLKVAHALDLDDATEVRLVGIDE